MDLVERLLAEWRRDPARVVLVEHGEGRRALDGRAMLALVAAQRRRMGDLDATGCCEPTGPNDRGRGAALGLLGDNSAELAAAFIAALASGVAVAPLTRDLPWAEVEVRAEAFGLAEVWSGAGVGEVARFAGRKVPDGAALLLSTSGTTGQARAVVLGRESLSRHTLGIASVLGLTPRDRVLLALPLAHSFGCRLGLLAPLAAGAVVHLMPRFSARRALALLEDEAITFAPVVPTMLSAWVALPGAAPGSLRWVLSAGAPLPHALVVRAGERLRCEVRQGYGLTEASFCTMDWPGDGAGDGPGEPAAPDTVGRPTPGVEVRLASDGEVEVRGVNLMLGYLDEPDATAAAFTDDGWLRTGDLGRFVAGRLQIVERKKDIVLVGGFTVYPAEVERVLAALPGVDQVAVFGEADDHLGERVVAAVVARERDRVALEGAILDEARRHLARHAVPARVVFVEALPVGPTGKVVRRLLRADAAGRARSGA